MAQITTVGKEFWFGFMDNHGVPPEAPDRGVVIITASETANGVIQYAGKSIDFNLAAGQQFVQIMDDADMLHRSIGVIENKGVYINSTGNISVYAFNERYRSADGTVILPLPTLGKDYYISSHYEVMTVDVNYNANINDESTLLVVSVEDNTEIEITPSVFTLSGNAAKTPFSITLNSGQSYQLKANGDLTGSRVRVIGDDASDCKNIAVFGGNKWTSVGDCGGANDHLFQQAYPVNTLGTDFIHLPLSGRTSGKLVKVLGSEDGTEISVDGNIIETIDAGEFINLNFDHGQVASIKTSKPSSVTVYSKSQECNDPVLPQFDNGDPFMITYSPNQQLLKSITFNALQLPSITNHYVNIIAKTSAVNATRLDGQAIGNQFTTIPQFPDFSYAQIAINQGVHNLTNPEGFIAYVYGFGHIESYGFAVGASLENLNFEVKPEYEFEIYGEKVACLNSEAIWEIIPDNDIFTYFVWDFGDGSDPVIGKEVNHIYTEEGTFEVKIKASVSENSCDQQEEINFEVEVIDIPGEIRGPNSVCPTVDEVGYEFQSDIELSRVIWEVEGGEIIAEEDFQITVLWGETNPNARVMVTPFNLEGCPGSPVELNVVINQILEPSIPEGETKICFDLEGTSVYAIPFRINGHIYEWFVENGEIISGGDSSEVTVRWNIPGVIGQVWFKEYSLLDEFCEGESPKLDVEINEPFEVSITGLLDVLCFGEAAGQIEINASGGRPPYRYEWNHDPTLNSPLAENLQSGTYTVLVRDSFGCEIVLEDIQIDEPELLELETLSTLPVSCYGKSDGEALIVLNGGTPPFSVENQQAQIIGNEIRFNGLEGGIYDIIVKDGNGCILEVELNVDSPLPLEVPLRILKPSCPGESNGELIAEPMDGQGPYTFIWDYDNSTSDALEGIARGHYTVTVKDNRGCVSFGNGEMIEEAPKVRMPTGFRPSEGPYMAVSNCNLTFELSVFNRWGEIIFFGDKGWDGRVEDTKAPIGSYSYFMKYEYNLNGQATIDEILGIFTLID